MGNSQAADNGSCRAVLTPNCVSSGGAKTQSFYVERGSPQWPSLGSEYKRAANNSGIVDS